MKLFNLLTLSYGIIQNGYNNFLKINQINFQIHVFIQKKIYNWMFFTSNDSRSVEYPTEFSFIVISILKTRFSEDLNCVFTRYRSPDTKSSFAFNAQSAGVSNISKFKAIDLFTRFRSAFLRQRRKYYVQVKNVNNILLITRDRIPCDFRMLLFQYFKYFTFYNVL